MITINKNSLIHRFNKKCGIKDDWWWDSQVSLCPYFWGTIGSLLKFLFFSGVALVFLSVVGSAILKGFFGDSIFDTYWIYLSPIIGAITISLLLVLTVVVVEGILWCRRKLYDRKVGKPVVEKDPSIFFEYIKSKKNKFCPRIQIK
ncbi:hypothetical protein APT65_00117 [Trabzonvirus APT65]|uniref:Uncharacterized protein n=1 Tax=Aeromonas phage APT65 TaxID=2982914 RepID=A0A9E8K2I8_9CAUD|nr:hypothetical protein APT65_00117 [Aeromonas phage APT65]